MSHTRGPWHWDSDPVKNDPTGRVRYRVVTTGKTITQMYYSSYEGGLTNAEDDARLISSAPDLLAALVLCLDTDCGELTDEARAAGKAALAKATQG